MLFTVRKTMQQHIEETPRLEMYARTTLKCAEDTVKSCLLIMCITDQQGTIKYIILSFKNLTEHPLTSVLLRFDLGLQVFGVDVLVVSVFFGRLALPVAETAAAATAAAGEQRTAQHQTLWEQSHRATFHSLISHMRDGIPLFTLKLQITSSFHYLRLRFENISIHFTSNTTFN